MQQPKFVILEVNQTNKTMLINWGQEKRWYKIPKTILDNPKLSPDEVVAAIEKLRPAPQKPISIPQGLQSLIDAADQEINQQYATDEVLL